MPTVTDEEFQELNTLDSMSTFSSLYSFFAYMEEDDEPSPDHLVRSYYALMHRPSFG